MGFLYFFGGIRLFTFFRLHRSQVLNYAVMFMESIWGVIGCVVTPDLSKVVLENGKCFISQDKVIIVSDGPEMSDVFWGVVL